jgi:hypothetical protein
MPEGKVLQCQGPGVGDGRDERSHRVDEDGKHGQKPYQCWPGSTMTSRRMGFSVATGGETGGRWVQQWQMGKFMEAGQGKMHVGLSCSLPVSEKASSARKSLFHGELRTLKPRFYPLGFTKSQFSLFMFSATILVSYTEYA